MTSATPAKKIVTVIITHAPYQGTLARSGLDTALAAAAFEQPVQLIFSGHGIYSLLEQDTETAGTRSISKLIASLPLYDIEPLHVEAAALAQLGVSTDALPSGVQLVDSQAITALIERSDHVVSF